MMFWTCCYAVLLFRCSIEAIINIMSLFCLSFVLKWNSGFHGNVSSFYIKYQVSKYGWATVYEGTQQNYPVAS